jgi:hypothetical protein
VVLPEKWDDPVRLAGKDQPDIGAIPQGLKPWPIGARGRLSVLGVPAESETLVEAPDQFLLKETELKKNPRNNPNAKPAVVLQGYPAFDAPLIEYALRKSQIPFQSMERTWLPPAEYEKSGFIIIVGDLRRAKIEPYQYGPEDLKFVSRFLKEGGTLLLMRGNASLFASPEGRAFLEDLTGGGDKVNADGFEIMQPRHAWLKHLEAGQTPAWVNLRNAQPLRASKGETIIGHPAGLATLYRLPVGKGQLIYVGWDSSFSLPNGRQGSTVEQETVFEQQMQLLQNIIQSLANSPK